MGRYHYLDEMAVADAALEVEGESLDDLFATAARAVAEMMVDPATMPLAIARTVTLAARSPDLLLYDWLSELIYRKDRDHEVFPEAEVEVSERDGWSLRATLKGGRIDPARTESRADPKAVTFHQFALERTAEGWRARVVIDI